MEEEHDVCGRTVHGEVWICAWILLVCLALLPGQHLLCRSLQRVDREHWPCLTQILKELLTKLEFSVHRRAAQIQWSEWVSTSCSLRLKSAELQTCASMSPTGQVCCRTGSLQHKIEQDYPKNSHSKVLPVWTQLNNSQVPELTSAPSLWYGLSRLKQLCQSNCLSKRAFVSKVVSGEELLFSPSLTIHLHCDTVMVDLCLLNLGISTSNRNNLFKYCCFNAVTDPLWKQTWVDYMSSESIMAIVWDPHSQRSNRKQVLFDVCRLVRRIFLEVSFFQKNLKFV